MDSSRRKSGIRNNAIWISASLAPLIIVCIFSDAFWSLWKITFKLSSPRPFLDLELITSNLRCHLDNPRIPISELMCDPGKRVFNYPEFMLWLASKMGIGSLSNFSLGIIFQVLFVVAIAFTLHLNFLDRKFRWTHLLLTAVICLSSPIFFVLERGNTDSLMFVMVVFGLSMVQKFAAFSFFLIMLAFMLKLYPAGAFIVFLVRRSTLTVSFISFFITLWIVINRSDLARVWKVSPTYQWDSYGLRVLAFQFAEYFSFPLAGRSGLIISTIFGGFLLAIALFIFYIIRNIKFFSNSVEADLKASLEIEQKMGGFVALGALGVFLTTYFMGMSWDTKLIFLLPFIFWCLLKDCVSLLLQISSFLVMFLSAPIYKPLQTVGDTLLVLYVGYILYIVLTRVSYNFTNRN